MTNKPKDQNTDIKKPDTDKKAETTSYLNEQIEGVKFLRTKFRDLHASPEAGRAAERAKAKIGVHVSEKPEARIANYLYRFREIMDEKDDTVRQRGIEWLKGALHELHVIKPEDIPESEYILEQRIARQLGHGDVEITEDFKRQKSAQIINNQKASIDRWVDYLFSPDADYPDWAKYWAFRSMLEMGKFQKKEEEDGPITVKFLKRRKDTAANFPVLNARALAPTISTLQDRLVEKSKLKAEQQSLKNRSTKLSDEEYEKLIATESFAKIYTQFLSEMPEYSREGLQEIRGEWRKYPQNSDARPLVKSLEGYPLEWCTANYDTARSQLQGGDFYVYYSINQDGEAKSPRLAIRMEQDKIAEVRGIAPNQNLDPYITPKLDEKLEEFGAEGKAYLKKSADMKRLTAIEEKHNAHKKNKEKEDLTQEELRFLYELDSPIEGFGYGRDPRIDEVKQGREIEEDSKIIDVIATLEDRFNNTPEHYKRPKGIDITKVRAALEANPDAKLSLALMEITGGAPDIIAETDSEYIFGDCSAQSPLGRRNMDWFQSYAMAERFGCQLMDGDTYKDIQKEGEFDTNSWSWLDYNLEEVKKTGRALRGYRERGDVYVYQYSARYHRPYYGWRGLLRVQKV